jgi:hypothetical protein
MKHFRWLNYFGLDSLTLGILIPLLFIGLFPLHSSAQSLESTVQDSTSKKITHDIGIAGGFTTGVGLAYRVWRGKWGAQVAFAPINTGDFEFYSVGFSYMLALKANNMNRFFLYQGNHFVSLVNYTEASIDYNYTSGVGVPGATIPAKTEGSRYFNNGLGFGYEFFENEGKPSLFGFSLQAGLAAYQNFTRANLTGEVSLMYRFR